MPNYLLGQLEQFRNLEVRNVTDSLLSAAQNPVTDVGGLRAVAAPC